jgi:hypothetical protein
LPRPRSTGAGCAGTEAIAPRHLCLDCTPAHSGWVACDVCRGIRLCPICVDTVEMIVCACCKERQTQGLAPDRERAHYGMACASCVFPGWVCEACDY